MDRLEAMSLLIAAVDAGSLSQAGRRLGMPLATVSRKVSELEAHLGTQLLHRSPRQLTLTDAGRHFVAAGRRILEDVEAAERAASGEYRAPKGELVISAPIVFGRLHVLPVVTAFLVAYPEVDVRMTLSDRVVDLAEERIDVAVRIGHLPDSSMIATRVGAIRRVTCASPAYLAERGTPRAPEDLAGHSAISFGALGPPLSWRFDTPAGERRVPIRPRLIVNTAEAAIDAAIAGLGITRILSYQAAARFASGDLVRLLAECEPPADPVHLIAAGDRLLPQKLRAFLDFAVPRLRDRLTSDAD